MQNVSVTPSVGTTNPEDVRYNMSFPPEYAPLLGEFVRPEGTLETGLVLHCHEPEARGRTYKVVTDANWLVIQLPKEYGKAGVPRIRTAVFCESTTVDGHTVVIFDKTFPAEWAPRIPRKIRNREPPRRAVPIVIDTTDKLAALRSAMVVVRRSVRHAELANAIITLIEVVPPLHAEIGWNGTEMTARIIQTL